MYIKSVELQNFRNYRRVSVPFHPKINIFLGQNAQGKTNLLESIYITSLGKSFRTNKDKELIQFHQEFCKVKLSAVKEDQEVTVEIAVNQDGKKGIKINGVKIKKTSELLEHIYISIFSPEDLKIVKEEPEKRRKFLDRELCQIKPSYYNQLNQYRRVLSQRNAYLKEPEIDETALDIWDAELAGCGAFVMAQREAFIRKINPVSGQIHQAITDNKEALAVSYEPSIRAMEQPKEQAAFFYEELKQGRSNDIRNKTTGKGPHKDDFKITVNGMDIRKFGSQGQQRTAALSLKLSEIKLIREETGEHAVLLLDDVLSELDQQRQTFLIQSLEETQIFITATEIPRELADSLPEGTYFFIQEGTVAEKGSRPQSR